MAITTTTVWIIHWLLVKVTASKESRECAPKSSHGPGVLPQFQSSEGGNKTSP